MKKNSTYRGFVACQDSLSRGFSRQEPWNGLPFPSPGALLDTIIEAASLALADRIFTTYPPGKPMIGSEELLK